MRTFLTAIDDIDAQREQIRAIIDTLLAEIEELVEIVYREPADANRMAIINAKLVSGENQGLGWMG